MGRWGEWPCDCLSCINCHAPPCTGHVCLGSGPPPSRGPQPCPRRAGGAHCQGGLAVWGKKVGGLGGGRRLQRRLRVAGRCKSPLPPPPPRSAAPTSPTCCGATPPTEGTGRAAFHTIPLVRSSTRSLGTWPTTQKGTGLLDPDLDLGLMHGIALSTPNVLIFGPMYVYMYMPCLCPSPIIVPVPSPSVLQTTMISL